MFRAFERLSDPAPAKQPRQYLRRALLFAGGLVLLWLALQLFPGRPGGADGAVYADAAGTVASNPGRAQVGRDAPSLVTPGNAMALVLLAGGGALAFVLRRRKRQPGTRESFIEPLATHTIAPGQQLRLVQCGGEVLLLGVTNHQINLLKRYPSERFAFDDVEAEADAAAAPSPAWASSGESPFAHVLRQYTGQPVHGRS